MQYVGIHLNHIFVVLFNCFHIYVSEMYRTHIQNPPTYSIFMNRPTIDDAYIHRVYYFDDFVVYGQEMTNQVAHSHSDFNHAARTTMCASYICIDFIVRLCGHQFVFGLNATHFISGNWKKDLQITIH